MANRPKLGGGEPITIEKAIVSEYNSRVIFPGYFKQLMNKYLKRLISMC